MDTKGSGAWHLSLFMWKVLHPFFQSCVVPFIPSPKLCPNTPLAHRAGWAYFLLEVLTSALEGAGRKTLKSISKQFFPVPIGLILYFALQFQLLLLGLRNRLLLWSPSLETPRKLV